MTISAGEGPATGPGARVLFELDARVAEEWTLISVSPSLVVWDVDFQNALKLMNKRSKIDFLDRQVMKEKEKGTGQTSDGASATSTNAMEPVLPE